MFSCEGASALAKAILKLEVKKFSLSFETGTFLDPLHPSMFQLLLLGANLQELKLVFDEFDKNSSGAINFDEWDKAQAKIQKLGSEIGGISPKLSAPFS